MSFFSHLPESARENTCYRSCTGSQVARKEVKAAKNLSIIVLFFMLCWFPLYTINCIMVSNLVLHSANACLI